MCFPLAKGFYLREAIDSLRANCNAFGIICGILANVWPSILVSIATLDLTILLFIYVLIIAFVKTENILETELCCRAVVLTPMDTRSCRARSLLEEATGICLVNILW